MCIRDRVEVGTTGTIKFHDMKVVKNSSSQDIVTSRSGEVGVLDVNGREREKYRVPYGAVISVSDGDKVEIGQIVATWDSQSRPLITETAGIVKFVDFVEGSSFTYKTDEETGLQSINIMDQRLSSFDKNLKPMIKLVDEKGNDINLTGSNLPAHFILPLQYHIQKDIKSALDFLEDYPACIVNLADGQKVSVGDVLAKIPTGITGTKDITGGLPRVADLFEAREPKDKAELAETTGTVSFGKETKGKRRLIITQEDGTQHVQIVGKIKPLNIFENDTINKGEVIAAGELNPHDILRYRGVTELAEYLVKEVQDVFRLQGVTINDKHLSLIHI